MGCVSAPYASSAIANNNVCRNIFSILWGRTPVLRPASTPARAGPGGPVQTWRAAPHSHARPLELGWSDEKQRDFAGSRRCETAAALRDAVRQQWPAHDSAAGGRAVARARGLLSQRLRGQLRAPPLHAAGSQWRVAAQRRRGRSGWNRLRDAAEQSRWLPDTRPQEADHRSGPALRAGVLARVSLRGRAGVHQAL